MAPNGEHGIGSQGGPNERQLTKVKAAEGGYLMHCFGSLEGAWKAGDGYGGKAFRKANRGHG
jgi:hypothetical protein